MAREVSQRVETKKKLNEITEAEAREIRREQREIRHLTLEERQTYASYASILIGASTLFISLYLMVKGQLTSIKI
ncbi:MAG: hypothetical protein QXE51_04635 [Nitrososphaeria archaeon]